MKIPADLDARLRHEAERRGVPISQISREALEAYLDAPAGRRRLGAAVAARSGRGDIPVRIRRDPRRRAGPIAALIVDGGPLYAYVDADDDHHRASLELLETHPGPLVVPTLVVTEVAYLLATRLGTVDASVVATAGRLGVTEIATLDRRRFGVVRPRQAASFRILP